MTQISTETLAAKAPDGVTVTEYRGYQLIDNDDYVTICRNAAIVQCAHTPEQARQNVDEIIASHESNERTALITTYRGYDIRDAVKVDGRGVGVDVYFRGAFVFHAPNVAPAKSRIDYAIAASVEQPAQPASAAQTAPSTLSAEARKAANAKKMGRHEPKETDLI